VPSASRHSAPSRLSRASLRSPSPLLLLSLRLCGSTRCTPRSSQALPGVASLPLPFVTPQSGTAVQRHLIGACRRKNGANRFLRGRERERRDRIQTESRPLIGRADAGEVEEVVGEVGAGGATWPRRRGERRFRRWGVGGWRRKTGPTGGPHLSVTQGEEGGAHGPAQQEEGRARAGGRGGGLSRWPKKREKEEKKREKQRSLDEKNKYGQCHTRCA